MIGELLFRILLRAYPREFRQRYADDLVAFFRQERDHPRYGSGPLRPLRFWLATLRDLSRTATAERLPVHIAIADRRTRRTPFAQLAFDFRNALRSLRTTPAVTLTAFLVVALGIGAGTAIFSVVDAVVLRGLPFADESTLVSVSETELATGRPVPAAYPNFADWVQRQDVFEALAASANGPWLTTKDSERPQRYRIHRITANLFDLLGVGPAIGPGIRFEDERSGARVALISDDVWRRQFNADPDVIGRSIAFDTTSYTVVGVMPRDFKYPIGATVTSAIDLWVPLTPGRNERERTGGRSYNLRVVARLKRGVSIEQAATRMARIRDELAAVTPSWFADRGIIVRPIKDSIVSETVRSWMLMLLWAVAAVFLVACANLANLLLARSASRQREIGVRAAMGATRWQIVRGLMVESVLLALAGAAGGVVLGFWGVDVLRATLPPALPRVWTIAVDLRVISIAALTAIATGIVCGLLPALQLSRTDVSAALRSGGRSATAGGNRQMVRTTFLAAEVALATILLVGAGIFGASFWRVVTTELGFSSAGVLHVDVMPPLPANPTDFASARKKFETSMTSALEAVGALPGVRFAALVAGGAPLTGSYSTQAVHVRGRSFEGDDEAVVKEVTPQYLETVGAHLLKGRGPGPEDTKGAPAVVVLNEEAARRYFGGDDPIGAELSIASEPPRTVVGVVRSMRLLGPESDITPEAYVPYAQSSEHSVSPSIVVRTEQDPTALVPTVKNAIWSVMPGVAIPEMRTFDEIFAGLIAQRKLNMILLAIFASLALLIASIGIYGMLAYFVEGRRKEIGVRMALGALPGAVLRMVLVRTVVIISGGLAIGLLASIWLEQLVMRFVFRGVPHDPLVYGAAAALLMGLGLLAAAIPARRASRVDPLITLRAE
jgi:putative ABC transport system permease protein